MTAGTGDASGRSGGVSPPATTAPPASSETPAGGVPVSRQAYEPGLAVAAVARRLGVAPATLRTWDRRYGLGPSDHSAGSHRRYSPADVERLLVMRRLTLDGVAPGDAARLARFSDGLAHTGVVDVVAPGRSARPDGADGSNPAVGALGASGLQMVGLPVAGRTHAVPQAAAPPETLTRTAVPHAMAPRATPPATLPTPTVLVDAALAGDEDRCASLLRLDPDARRADLEAWWGGLLEPALAELVRRTVVDRPGSDAVLTVHAAAVRSLRAWVPPAVRGAPVALVIVPPGPTRPLVAQALAAALLAESVDARIVGGAVSGHRATELVAMVRPRAVLTVLTAPQPADTAMVRQVAEDYPDLPQFVLVPDESAHTLPLGHSVHRVRSFAGTMAEVMAVVGAPVR